MDVNLLVVIITSIVFVSVILLLLFSVDLSQVNNFIFFKNEKYHRLTYFVLLGIVLFLINIVLFDSGTVESFRHIAVIALLLILFRRGVVEK
tara:strand:+ start:276 stop:551 length:276 start_codon:yes stop_codon:yes gene_type:complete